MFLSTLWQILEVTEQVRKTFIFFSVILSDLTAYHGSA
jgi:hypothetical protein